MRGSVLQVVISASESDGNWSHDRSRDLSEHHSTIFVCPDIVVSGENSPPLESKSD